MIVLSTVIDAVDVVLPDGRATPMPPPAPGGVAGDRAVLDSVVLPAQSLDSMPPPMPLAEFPEMVLFWMVVVP